jgi:hypothetical protein
MDKFCLYIKHPSAQPQAGTYFRKLLSRLQHLLRHNELMGTFLSYFLSALPSSPSLP